MRSVERRALVVVLAIVMVSAALVAAVSGSVRVASPFGGPPGAASRATAPGDLASATTPDRVLERFLNGAGDMPGYWSKMSSSVRSAALSASGSMEIAIYTDDVAELGAWLRSLGVPTLVGSVHAADTGLRVVTLEVPAKLLEKIAALDHVVAVAPAVVPQAPDRADPDLPARSDASGPAPTIIEAGKGHHVPEAWALGYTGSGINVAVMDSGIDFGHPDLQGTFAIETDLASPYYGWPLAFDPNSMALYLLSGQTFPSAPRSWYVNTSFSSGADGAGDLLLPFRGHTYNVLGIPSASGSYHLGLHPDGTLPYYWDEYPAVLVTDSVLPGEYDTVYVDLNDDYAFGNDKPADETSPEVWADYYDAGLGTSDFSFYTAGDGIADLSGGMIYFIADGSDPIPYSDVIGNRYGLPVPTPGAGDLVAFMIGDVTSAGGDHGTLCASAIVAQNVTGHVLGFAPAAKLIAVGNIYAGGFGYDIWQFVGEGYDGIADTGDEAQVASASFGTSGVDNDGWDYEARFVELMSLVSMGTAFTVSTGNGGHGFGTVTTPGSSNGVISVGASTSYNREMGVEGFEDAAHSTFGDVQPWSNRGPSTLGMAKPDVVTVGAWATGDGAVNSFFFDEPWTVWGGTSLSAPATAGIVALIAEAWINNGLGVPWINVYGKWFLVDGADNIHYDPQVMGHGLANAYRSVRSASLQGGIIAADFDTMFLPTADWAAGDYRGTKSMSFAHIMSPGQTNTTTFEVVNANAVNSDTVTLADWELQKTGSQTFYVNATNTEESYPLDFLRPDYLLDLTADVPAGTNLVKATLTFPYSQFDPNGNYVRDSSWRLVLYDWKDYNLNGVYWNDANGNGVVNAGEMDTSAGTEVMRFTYGYPTGTNIEAIVHDPLSRIHDGLLVGIQHRFNSTRVPFTNLTLTVDYYQAVDAPWLSEGFTSAIIPPMGSATGLFSVTLPASQPYGTLSAVVTITNATGMETQVPVLVNVAANGTDFSFGGDPTSTAFLDNNRVFGGVDWTWRAEAGDWRFFFTDIPDSTPVAAGDTLLVHTWWENVPTDIDTLIMGPTVDPQFSGPGSPWGPYTLATLGGSANALIGAGTWRFQTATGGAEEWAAAPLQTGLHEIALHNVNYAGLGPSEVFHGEVGRFSLTPNPWIVTTPNLTGSARFAVNASLTLPGLDALAFGIAQPYGTFGEPIADGGGWVRYFSAADIGLIDLQLDESYAQGMDIDLYLYRWTGSTYGLVASSAGPTAQERIRLTMPADGDYAVLVDGYSVPSGVGYFDLYEAVVAGTGLIPTNIPTSTIPAGTPTGFDVTWDFDPAIAPGASYLGVLFVGPGGAPAVEVDVVFFLYDAYDPRILAAEPADGASVGTRTPTVTVDYVDPEITSGIAGVQFRIDGLDLSFAGSYNATQFVWSMPFDLSEGVHDLNLTVMDGWGHRSYYAWSITIDTTGPPLSVTSPAYALTNVTTATVAGTTEAGATVTVNGNPVTVAPGGAFSATVTLSEGSNALTVVARDSAGNTATVVKTVTRDTTAPALAITSPGAGAPATSAVHVVGTAEVGASLIVNGVAVAVDSAGDWSVDIALPAGGRTITAVATDAAGNSATVVRTLSLDTTAPVVTVNSPAEGLQTNLSTVIVSGTVDDPSATVLVNGIQVHPNAQGAWSVSVALSVGSNAITVSAMDAAGNQAIAVTRQVTYTSPVPGLQNGIDQNEQTISGLSGTVWIVLAIAIVVAAAFAFAVYAVLNRKIGLGPGKPPEPPQTPPPPKEDMGGL